MLFMWQDKSLFKKLSFEKIDVSTTNQCYTKKRTRDWDELRESCEYKEFHEHLKS